MHSQNVLGRVLFVLAIVLGAVVIGYLLGPGREGPMPPGVIGSLIGASMCALLVSRGLPAPSGRNMRQMAAYGVIWIVIGLGIVFLYLLRA